MNRAGRWLGLAARVGLAAAFLAAAGPKLRAPADFALAVFRYHLLPYALVNAVALLLPWVETVAALALLLAPRYRRPALLLLGALLVVFTAAKLAALARGLDLSCGCFTLSTQSAPLRWRDVLLNVGLLALLVPAWRSARPPPAA